MRQIPDAYWTDAHGAVFAYAARDDVHACCVTWRDQYITLHHDELKPLPRVDGRPDMLKRGMLEIMDLDDAVSDMMAPHYADGNPKPSPKRQYDVGQALLGRLLSYAAVYAPGETIRGWGTPPRPAAPLAQPHERR